MTYVLDASVALKWVLLEHDSDKVIRLRNAARSGEQTHIAPDVFPVEIGHGLTKAERQGRLPVGQAVTTWLEVMDDAPDLIPYVPLMKRACAIASAHRTGVYDCLYVVLAEQEGCEMVTADDRSVANLGRHFPFIRPLASFP